MEPQGFDVPRVTSWVVDQVPGIVPPLRWSGLPGGHSNFTYRVDDEAGRAFVLRRPPLGELLPTAHDMRREFRVISALWPTPVPVPEPLALCENLEVCGAVFYAMGWVEGRSLMSAQDAEEHLTPEDRAATGPSFIETLAALHSLDPDEIGLGDLGKRDSYVGRQLRRWYASWEASKTEEVPDMDHLYAFLMARLPEQQRVSVVHGDYGLHNTRVAKNGTIAAVTDWEISTLGDPLADLAYTINAWSAKPTEGLSPATSAPGFTPADELLDRYVELTGIDVGQIDYYRCFNHWKTASIVQGVYARYLHGQKGTEGVDVDGLKSRVGSSCQLALEAAERLPA
jgi:aminoglycoside phosphotransferase (APT) family kinase protein